jgi:glutamate dehydrogenase
VIDAGVTPVDGPAALGLWIVAFNIAPLRNRREAERSLGTLGDADPELRLLAGLRATLGGAAEDDVFNRLILDVGLDWRQVEVIRAYHACCAQLGNAPTKAFAAEVLLRHAGAARALMELFAARFDPDLPGDRDREQAQQRALEQLDALRAPIRSAAEDRVLAGLRNLILATQRTSFYARAQGEPAAELAFKLDSAQVREMPAPCPVAEIFVYSPRMAGVHLRGGRVARGGVRWSDRPLDLRTEVLGLMRAQMVKNGVIVPVGSKGGFVLRAASGERAAQRAEADRQYERFIDALLSLTDNVGPQGVVPPARVVRHDGDDPYLVVAADKGTAHLSDTANRVARARGFWLDDAFASGGSMGYDHKALAITARGAWVCARRHFLELGVDPDRTPLRIAGIGDMSGDVFGNGLLLGRGARLIAAFNGQHVFVDPDPDPEVAWRERKRLFELPGSTWTDYDRAALSEGGGVFERGARAIALSPQARAALGLEGAPGEALDGEALVRAVLRAPVDLLWNGGIGTYVKASGESHADAGDRANDAVRVDARELRARVVAEGGNLGFTPRARVEYELAGGRINTDALDNSGGVDLSDHEVNYKLALAQPLREGRLPADERNAQLRACADDACAAVLAHSASQARCVSLDQIRSWQDPERMALAVDFLAREVGLDPRLESLPDRDAIRARAAEGGRRGYARAEVCVLLGHTKGLAKRALVAAALPDHPALGALYRDYFPPRLREAFGPELDAHPLRREIAATCLVNRVIDCAGVTLVPELMQGLGTDVAEVVAAYYTADLLLEAEALRARIEALRAPEPLRLRARLRVEDGVRLAAGVCLALERRALFDPDEQQRWRAGFAELRAVLPECVDPAEAAAIEQAARALAVRGLELDLARELEWLQARARSFGALQLSQQGIADLRRVAAVHARLGEATRIRWLLERLEQTDRSDGWRRVTAETLYLEMLQAQRDLTRRALVECGGAESPAAAFLASDALPARLRQIEAIAALIESGHAELAPLIVLSQQIRRLC